MKGDIGTNAKGCSFGTGERGLDYRVSAYKDWTAAFHF